MRMRLASWSAASRARCSSGEILGLADATFTATFAASFAGKCRVFLARSGIVRGNFATWSDWYSGILGGSATAAHRCHRLVYTILDRSMQKAIRLEVPRWRRWLIFRQ